MTRTTAGCLIAAAVAAASAACGGSSGSSPTPVPTAGTCAAGAPVAGVPGLTARLVASGLRNPLDLQAAPGDRERVYVVEQGGRIRVIRGGQLQAAPFLDVASRLSSGGERGLLGLAFHPQFAANRRFFVNYTNPGGDTHLAEYRAASADAADPASERLLLVAAQPFSNHNGGGLAFDASGRLLVALGDGGSGGDPLGNGQRLDTLLGKILRIDVDAGSPYAVPADNPFRAIAGARPEIWAYGLRNPFKIAVDGPTGDLYVGDVGQNRVEEIDVGLASRRGGENYGWNVTEGSQCYSPASGCDRGGLTPPVYEYTHAEGCSVTGGVVYRGCRMPDLAGTYFFGDFCSGLVRSFRLANGQAAEVRDWTSGLRGVGAPSSFGLDGDGEVYVVDYDGEVYRLEPAG
ncbi:MAG TPA: PQQ-dependent sugar dehydrogenase [Vicinamibacteria bacterium]